MINLTDLVNISVVTLYVFAVIAAFCFLYGYISNYDLYPYSGSPFLFSALLAITIVPGAFVILQIIDSEYYNDNIFTVMPKFKFKKKNRIQYCDTEKLTNIWNCPSESKHSPSLIAILRGRTEKLYRR